MRRLLPLISVQLIGHKSMAQDWVFIGWRWPDKHAERLGVSLFLFLLHQGVTLYVLDHGK